jgi:glucan phosphoethanolaminetransferase (alkaline phosphatase superfamily)
LLPNLFVAFLSADLSESLVKKFAYLVFSLLILLLPALFLKLRWYFLFESLFMLIAPFEIGYVWVFNATTTDGYISSLFHTNRGEAIELLTTVHWQIIILLGIWFAYYYIVFKKITNHYLFKKNASIAIGLTFLVFNLLLFGAMYMLEYRRTKSDIRMDLVVDNYINKYRKTYPCNIITTVLRIQQNDRLVHKMQKSTASFSYHAGQPSPPSSSEREIYMVIIGESARYENFSINGYARETSPLLAKKEGLLSYSNVYAASNVTEYALPLLLSRATPVDPQAAYREKTFVDAFRECGFYTAWIANQASYYPYIQRITNMVDVAHISLNDFDDVGNYDGLLLPYIDSVLNRNEPKTMLVVHTLGSHFRYNYRYPKSFEKFTPALQGAGNYGMVAAENKELLINSYDNTICYTDYILSEIINRVAGHNSLSAVIYVSDHAENLFDQGGSLILHGNKNPTVKEFHVPFLIWTSAKYQSFYENKQKSLEANINQPLSVSNLFHTVLDMAGIRYPGETLEKSIASETFTADSIRYVYTVNKQLIHF